MLAALALLASLQTADAKPLFDRTLDPKELVPGEPQAVGPRPPADAPPPPRGSLVVLLPAPQGELVQSEVMLPGRAFVGSRRFEEDLGGFGSSANVPVPARPGDGEGLRLVLEEEAVPWGDHAGILVRLVNRSGAPLQLRAQDSRISLVQEAWIQGEWRPVEHLPGSSCGNSYHRVELPDGQAWELRLPRYGGPEAVWLRARLPTPEGELTTGAYLGGLSAGQLGKDRGHKSPTGLMDPVGW